MIERSDLMRKTLYEVAEVLELHPEFYDQEVWGDGKEAVHVNTRVIECPTIGCIAGHAAASMGLEPLVFDHPSGGYVIDWGYVMTTPEIANLPAIKAFYQGREVAPRLPVSAVVPMMWEMDTNEADVLFSSGWRPPMGWSVEHALRAIADGTSVFDL